MTAVQPRGAQRRRLAFRKGIPTLNVQHASRGATLPPPTVSMHINHFTFTSLCSGGGGGGVGVGTAHLFRTEFHYTHHCYYVKSYAAFVIVGGSARCQIKLCMYPGNVSGARGGRNDFETLGGRLGGSAS